MLAPFLRRNGAFLNHIKEKRSAKELFGKEIVIMNSNNTEISRSTVIKKGVIAVICAFLAMFAGELTALFLKNKGMSGELTANLMIYISRSIVALIPFALLGGMKWFKFGNKAVGKTFRFARPLLICNMVIGILLAVSALFSGVKEGAAGRILLSIPIVLFVGINEEVIFRGLMLGGIQAIVGKRKSSLMIAAVVSSILFGFMHVMGSIDFSSALGILTAVLKTIEAGMLAVVLCYCCAFYHDMKGPILFHSIFDWGVLISSLLLSSDISADYTSSEKAQGFARIVMYIVLIVVYLPRTIKAIKGFRAAESTDGVFGNGGDDVTEHIEAATE